MKNDIVLKESIKFQLFYLIAQFIILFIYVFIFFQIYPYFKEDTILLLFLPVIGAGWHLGFIKGSFIVLLYYIVNFFLLIKFKNYNLQFFLNDILNYLIITAIFVLSAFLKRYFKSFKNKNTELETEKEKLKNQIAETLSATKELEKSQNFLEKILNAITDPIFVKDADHNFILFNDAFCKLSGHERFDFAGKNDYDFFPKEQVDVFWHKDNQVFETGREDINEETITDSDGKLRWLSTKKTLITVDNVKYLVGIIRDITERKSVEDKIKEVNTVLEIKIKERTGELEQANKLLEDDIKKQIIIEEELQKEKERLAVTLKSIGDGVIAADIKSNIMLMNEIAEEITGWSQEESLGKELTDVFKIINDNTGLKISNPVEKVLQDGKIINLENNTVLIAKDGTKKIITDSGAPIRDSNGMTIGVVLVFRDVTEKYQIENKLINAQRLESIGVLAGGIAHDFNNLLTGIFGFIELAQKNISNKQVVSDCLNEAGNVLNRAKDLTLQLLTFSKGGSPLKKTGQIGRIIKNCVNFVLSGSKVFSELEISEDLWFVNFDENQISQAIDNLLINAHQAMPNGGKIYIKAENVTLDENKLYNLAKGDYIKITIKDQGVGITKENQQKIFDPFFTTKKTGSGLGLTSTYSIIKNHNGHIECESELDKGTSFFIYIPASQYNKEQKTDFIIDMHFGKGKVLVMDDESFINMIINEYLKNMGYESVMVKNGDEAINEYQKSKILGNEFKFVILDLTIHGGKSGKDTVYELLKINPDLIAIASSGYSDDPVMANPSQYGFKEILTKPYTYSDLCNVLNRLFKDNNC